MGLWYTTGLRGSGHSAQQISSKFHSAYHPPPGKPCLRRIDGNKMYPGSIANEVHADGEIWSRALYDIWTQLGNATADTLVIQSHFYLTASANFNAGANAIIAADRARYSGSHESALRSIFAARGIPVTI